MTRHEQRETAFKLLFEQAVVGEVMSEIILIAEEINKEKIEAFAFDLVCGVDSNISHINHAINKYSTKWKVDRLSKVSLAVLRLCIYEIMYEKDIPVSVSINEAVELAKIYGDKDDAPYVNGVLSSVAKDKELVCEKTR
ncbi:MAG: transcription antitermination factor NusB [Clostridia bacterium]